MSNIKKTTEPAIKVTFLGGVGEIGKNMTALEFGDDIIVVDCGLAFPSSDMPGVDLVIPDYSYLFNNRHKVRGIVLTHGHEDHIGALPFVLKDVPVPVFGTKLTLAILDGKLREHKVDEPNLVTVKPKSIVKLGNSFKVEFIQVNHSISGSCAIAIHTPIGVVVHSGDFKVDYTPIDGATTDLARLGELGGREVLLFMCESTNVERSGHSMSEQVVGVSLDGIFADNMDRRILVATFASNIHRLQQIIDLAKKYKRKVAFSGRSMINISDSAAKIGELRFSPEDIIDIDKINNFADKELVIITTGSQGEPMSALTRMSSNEFNKVKLGINDTIVISASPIPGNERMIYSVINNLYKLGTRVIYESLRDVHVSGHAYAEELKLFHSLLRPKFFVPVHGEYRHLKRHAELAEKMGMRSVDVFVPEIGNQIEITKRAMRMLDNVSSGSLLVDGLGVGEVGNTVLRDRKHLAEEGFFVVTAGIDSRSGELTTLEFSSRGFVYEKEAEDVYKSCDEIVRGIIGSLDLRDFSDYNLLKTNIRNEIKRHLFRRTRKNPFILVAVVTI
ncbi:MAG: ribonuclease J [Firmicutes bacterium]|nr:ribonuclease J [Bacillota bacterium]